MRLIVLVSMLLVPCSLAACPSIEGTWRSSLEHFVKFNDRWAKGDKKFRSGKEQAQGKTTISFSSDGVMTLKIESHDIILGGKNFPHPGDVIATKYQVLGCIDKKVAIKYDLYGSSRLHSLNFEGRNRYWVYKGSSKLSGHDHIREYFVKVD